MVFPLFNGPGLGSRLGGWEDKNVLFCYSRVREYVIIGLIKCIA